MSFYSNGFYLKYFCFSNYTHKYAYLSNIYIQMTYLCFISLCKLCIVSYFEGKSIMYQHYRIQDKKLSGLQYLMLQVCVNVCVSKLVFSFNYETAFLLISRYIGTLIYFEETSFSLTETLMLMTSSECISAGCFAQVCLYV